MHLRLADGRLLLTCLSTCHSNQLGGTMPPSWGTFNDRAGDVRDLNLWSQGISVQLQVRRLACECRTAEA